MICSKVTPIGKAEIPGVEDKCKFWISLPEFIQYPVGGIVIDDYCFKEKRLSSIKLNESRH